MSSDRISEIYKTTIETPEFYKLIANNNFDISWLHCKLNDDEYIRLENEILDYGNKNDELLFKAGFQYAWDLFLQCSKKQ